MEFIGVWRGKRNLGEGKDRCVEVCRGKEEKQVLNDDKQVR